MADEQRWCNKHNEKFWFKKKLVIIKKTFIIYKYIKLTEATYYQKNKETILNRAKEYYKNNKERLIEQATNTYGRLSDEEKI